jgi:hypothetical protein
MALVSDSRKFIFIHIPKTGGTSIESALKDYCIAESLSRPGSDTHASAISTRVLYGKEKFDKYFKFAVVRNPYERELSYFFYAAHGLLTRSRPHIYKIFLNCDVRIQDTGMGLAAAKGPSRARPLEPSDATNNTFSAFWNSYVAALFHAWAHGQFCTFSESDIKESWEHLIHGQPFMGHPHGMHIDYLLDNNGTLAVDHLIRFEHLQADFDLVCEKLKLPKLRLDHKKYSRDVWMQPGQDPQREDAEPALPHVDVAHIHSLVYNDYLAQFVESYFAKDFELLENFFKT